MTLSPRHKLIGAALLALVAPLLAAAQGASAATTARVLLGLTAAGGLAFWFIRARGGLDLASKFKTAPRLNVVQRVGLSQRTGLALIEVDGKPYLVVHGDGFAKISPARRPTRVALPGPKVSHPALTEEEGAPS
ncbi:MAG: flagellar biosynthetic protein FliO [Archangium sp.]|nr:flagellar biosynthetic protein FliO [Archangium sp.]